MIMNDAPEPSFKLKKRFDLDQIVRHHSGAIAGRAVTDNIPTTAAGTLSGIPPYATACAGTSSYASACSCIGATGLTVTASAPTSTIVAAPTSINIVPRKVKSKSFYLQADGGPFNGQFAHLALARPGFNDQVIVFGSRAVASAFKISPTGQLSNADAITDASGHPTDATYFANTAAGVPAYILYFNTAADVSANGYVEATCNIEAKDSLRCVDQTEHIFQICPGLSESGDGVTLGDSVNSLCTAFNFRVVAGKGKKGGEGKRGGEGNKGGEGKKERE